MDLLEIRTNLVRDTGHWELVTDAEDDDFTDNGADRFIKDGQQMLDELCPPPVVTREQVTRVFQGQYLVYIPQIRALENVKIYDSDGAEYDIEHVEYRELLDLYDEELPIDDESTPEYISLLPIRNQSYVSLEHSSWYVIGNEITINEETGVAGPLSSIENVGNESFWDQDGTLIAHSVDAKYTGITLSERLSDIFNYIFKSIAVCVFPDTFIGEMTVSVDVTLTEKMRLLCIPYTVLESDDGIYVTEQPEESDGQYINETGKQTLNFEKGSYNSFVLIPKPIAEEDELLWSDDILEESCTINNVYSEYLERSANAIIIPPADKVYKIKTISTAYDAEFTDDDSETWWSVNHPELLILAARVGIETSLHRNESGAQAIRNQIQQRIMEISAHLTYQRVSGRHDKAVING